MKGIQLLGIERHHATTAVASGYLKAAPRRRTPRWPWIWLLHLRNAVLNCSKSSSHAVILWAAAFPAALPLARFLGRLPWRIAAGLPPSLTQSEPRLIRARWLRQRHERRHCCGKARRARHCRYCSRPTVEPKDFKVSHLVGLAYTQLQQFEKAAEFYRKALQLNPGFHTCPEDLGTVLWFSNHKVERSANFCP